jgi:D-sedoheptulose 7-phosphate isomerase
VSQPATGPSAVERLIARLPVLEPTRASLEAAIEALERALCAGGTVLVCGNGGSASDSEHLVADLMKGFRSQRRLSDEEVAALAAIDTARGTQIAAQLQGALPAISLGSEGALTTAIANDIGFDMVFAQRVFGLGRPGDVLIAISTTGNSSSVVNAALVAHSRAMTVIALTGRDGGEVAALADISIRVPADQVFEIQELHLPVYHAIALALEEIFFTDDVERRPQRASDGTRRCTEPVSGP